MRGHHQDGADIVEDHTYHHHGELWNTLMLATFKKKFPTSGASRFLEEK